MKRTPSPALVISIVALFVALGGTSYAAVKLNGKNIKKGTVSGTALKKDTLGGTQIKESKLAKVPSAVSADSAADAAKLGGLAPDAFTRGNAGVITRNVLVPASSTSTLLDLPGLMRISGTCNGADQFGLRLDSYANGVSVRYAVIHNGSTVLSSGSVFNAGNYLPLSYYANPSFKFSIWRNADPTVAYEVSGSALLCSANAVAVGHG